MTIFPRSSLIWTMSLVIYKKTFKCPFCSWRFPLYNIPSMGSKNIKITRNVPDLNRLCFFSKVEPEYQKDLVFGYLNRFLVRNYLWTHAYGMLSIHLY